MYRNMVWYFHSTNNNWRPRNELRYIQRTWNVWPVQRITPARVQGDPGRVRRLVRNRIPLPAALLRLRHELQDLVSEHPRRAQVRGWAWRCVGLEQVRCGREFALEDTAALEWAAAVRNQEGVFLRVCLGEGTYTSARILGVLEAVLHQW